MAQSNHEELVFLQRSPEDNKWFEQLLKEELVDDPVRFRSYIEAIEELKTKKISHSRWKIRMEILFQNYPTLLLGMMHFAGPETNFVIPDYLLNEWTEHLTRARSLTPLESIQLRESHHTSPIEIVWFRDFLKLQSDIHAIVRGSYGSVLALRYQLHIESGAALIPLPMIQSKVQHFLTMIKSHCERCNKTPLYEQLLQIFRVYGLRNLPGNIPENRIPETEVCQQIFSLFREKPLWCILIDFNLVLPFLSLIPYLSLF